METLEIINVDTVVQQGIVLDPILCSSSTGEYCNINKGVNIGGLVLNSLLFVDDVMDLSQCSSDAILAHENALLFAKQKKLRYKPTKCKTMVVNGQKGDSPPMLKIDGTELESVEVFTYLGDVFNSKGTNKDLIDDRVIRGTKAMVSIAALLAETSLGIHHVSVYLLLYRSLFLSSTLFNAQAWSYLSEKELQPLVNLQVRLLKGMLGVPSSTATCFTFLELGILPLKYEIHKRQITFLHHILTLTDEDPVKRLFRQMQLYPQCKNWAKNVDELMATYEIQGDEKVIKEMDKKAFARTVSINIKMKALEELNNECKNKSKTAYVTYSSLSPQEYFKTLYPDDSKIVFKARAKILEIKTHVTYKFDDRICRLCNKEEENLDHAVNCGEDTSISFKFDKVGVVEEDCYLLYRVVKRIKTFLKKVKDKELIDYEVASCESEL